MKHNNNSKDIRNWTTWKLKTTALEYDDLIHGQNPCYGIKDITMLDNLLNELSRRGYKRTYKLTFE